jgi:hypothetical protein
MELKSFFFFPGPAVRQNIIVVGAREGGGCSLHGRQEAERE